MHLPSAALVVSAVLCLVAGAALIRNGALGTACLTGGVGLAGMFLAVQRRLPKPLVDIDALMRNRVLRNALLTQLLLYVNAFSSTFMLSIYMQVALGESARVAGQVLAIGTVMMAILALGLLWAPSMALLSDAAEVAGLDLGFAAALVNLAWAGGQVIGGTGGARLAETSSDTVPYLVVAGLFALTSATLLARRLRPARA